VSLTLLLLILFLLSTGVQLIYWGFLYGKLLSRIPTKNKENTGKEGVSVIICAKNEAANLQRNLPNILAQNYPKFELIVVNDHSLDNSWEIILDFQKKSPILQPINLNQESSLGKKEALTRGIEASKYDLLLLTDADCSPASPFWISTMVSGLSDTIKIGLGYGPFYTHKGFLNTISIYETVLTAISYLSFSVVGLPYMGVGRNLIYRKSLFTKVGGFRKHAHLTSGDDDLFINQVANKKNTTMIITPSAFVFSEAETSWQGYYYQKSRHLSTGSSYKLVHQVLLGLFSASHFLHYFSLIALFLFHHYLWIISIGYGVRILNVVYVMGSLAGRLSANKIKRLIPILDFLYIFYYLIFAPSLFKTRNRKKWK